MACSKDLAAYRQGAQIGPAGAGPTSSAHANAPAPYGGVPSQSISLPGFSALFAQGTQPTSHLPGGAGVGGGGGGGAVDSAERAHSLSSAGGHAGSTPNSPLLPIAPGAMMPFPPPPIAHAPQLRGMAMARSSSMAAAAAGLAAATAPFLPAQHQTMLQWQQARQQPQAGAAGFDAAGFAAMVATTAAPKARKATDVRPAGGAAVTKKAGARACVSKAASPQKRTLAALPPDSSLKRTAPAVGRGRGGVEGPRRKSGVGTKYLLFEPARAFVRSLGLTSQRAYWQWVQTGGKPENIPSNPHQVYRLYGWLSWRDWLGTAPNAAPRRRGAGTRRRSIAKKTAAAEADYAAAAAAAAEGAATDSSAPKRGQKSERASSVGTDDVHEGAVSSGRGSPSDDSYQGGRGAVGGSGVGGGVTGPASAAGARRRKRDRDSRGSGGSSGGGAHGRNRSAVAGGVTKPVLRCGAKRKAEAVDALPASPAEPVLRLGKKAAARTEGDLAADTVISTADFAGSLLAPMQCGGKAAADAPAPIAKSCKKHEAQPASDEPSCSEASQESDAAHVLCDMHHT